MAVAEVIVICIDDSTGMLDSATFEAQRDAIKFYCQAKLDANPENEVVLFRMGSARFGLLLNPPTRDFQNILDCLRRITPGSGSLSFLDSICHARAGFIRCSPHKKKKMLFFVGGLHDMDSTKALIYGKKLKDLGIAVDVVNFYLGEKPKRTVAANQFGRMELDGFINATRCYNNSHIEHVKSESPICDVLCKSILKGTPGLYRIKNRHKKATGKNQAEAATDNKHVPNLNRFEALSLADE